MKFAVRLSFSLLAAIALAASAPQTLREAASTRKILIGTAVRPSLLSEAAYAQTLAREFNMLEPEDAMKWSNVRPSPETFDFSGADKIVAFAKAHDMKVRGHCLVWDHQNPDWLNVGTFTPAQLSDLLRQHISTEVRHFAPDVFAWDVVNEALDENGKFKDSPWYNKPGIALQDKNSSYVEQAFRWAHEADPKALLFYNENGAEGLGKKSEAVYALMKDLLHRGVPINGVGLQMHISHLDFDTGAVATNIQRLAALGLQIHITELDVSLPVDASGRATSADLTRQAEIYRGIVHACRQSPACTAIQTWGFTDKYSWIPRHSKWQRGAALPFDAAYKPKAAYAAMLGELTDQR